MSRAARAYRVMLYILPPRFRREAADEMTSTFAMAHARAAATGPGARIRVWWIGFVDLIRTAGAEWRGPGSSGGSVQRSARLLWRSKGFTAAAVATFALGIGVNLSVLAVVDQMLFRPLPYRDVDRLMHVHSLRMSSGPAPTLYVPTAVPPALQASASFEGAATFAGFNEPTTFDEVGQLALDRISWNGLRLLGVSVVAGRDFEERDAIGGERPSLEAAILLREEVWTSRFGRSNDVFGRVLRSGQWLHRVVGVLPRGLLLPSSSFAGRTDGVIVDRTVPRANSLGAAALVRLRPGVTRPQVEQEVESIVARLRTEFPQDATLGSPLKFADLRGGVFGLYRSRAWLVFAAVGAVLLIACVNLTALFLARGRSRERDAAVRSALGASRRQIVKDELTQSLMVCGLGAAAGVVLCVLTFDAVMALVPASLRPIAVEPLDTRLLALVALVTTAAAVMTGLLPAWRASKVNLVESLRNDGRTNTGRLRGGATLLAIEAAMGIVLVAGAAATVRSFAGMALKDPGYDANDLYEVNVQHGYKPGVRGYEPMRVAIGVEVVRSMPGVVAAGPTNRFPAGRSLALHDPFWSAYGATGALFGVGQGFFDALSTPLVAGRDFTADEVRDRAPVAMVNLTGASVLWPGVAPADVIGRVVATPAVTRTVVGVTANIRPLPGVQASPALMIPLTAPEAPASMSAFVMAIRMAPGLALDRVELDRRLDAALGSNNMPVRVLSDVLPPHLQEPRFQAVLFASVAGIGLLLAALGLYAVAAFDVAQRRFEISVRMSLGATAADVRRFVVRNALKPVLVGVALGSLAAWWLATSLQAFITEVDARDPWTAILVAVVLLATSVAAAWIPARKAAGADPAAVLRAG